MVLKRTAFRSHRFKKKTIKKPVLTSDFHFSLPSELIAQVPTERRDRSRLLVVDRRTESISHQIFTSLPDFLRSGDLLVVNNSKVIPARLGAKKKGTNGKIEILLLEQIATNDWWAMLRPAKKVPIGRTIFLLDDFAELSPISATVLEKNETGHRRLRFSGTTDILNDLPAFGEMPLPPYIERETTQHRAEDLTRYQTVYSKPPGSVAAPTAGLHFTPELLSEMGRHGVNVRR